MIKPDNAVPGLQVQPLQMPTAKGNPRMKMIIGLGVLTAAVAVLYGHVLNTTRIRCACKGCSG